MADYTTGDNLRRETEPSYNPHYTETYTAPEQYAAGQGLGQVSGGGGLGYLRHVGLQEPYNVPTTAPTTPRLATIVHRNRTLLRIGCTTIIIGRTDDGRVLLESPQIGAQVLDILQWNDLVAALQAV